MVIKLPIGDFELEIGLLRIRDLGFNSQSPILKLPKFQITNRSFYHQLVISTFGLLCNDILIVS